MKRSWYNFVMEPTQVDTNNEVHRVLFAFEFES